MTGTSTPRRLWGAVPPPEPHEWRPPPSMRQRVQRALATPLAIGVGLFLLAIVGAIAFVALQPHTPPLPEETAVEGVTTEGALDSAGHAAATPDPASVPVASATLLVHVVGEVRRPGVVELQPHARVTDAIAAAGGATDTAALEGVNLARPVADGEQILVPNAEQLASGSVGPDASAYGGSGQTGDGRVNLNTADAAGLQTLPGVGPALAQRILDWRASNGAFVSVDQLVEVSGIGSKTLETLRDWVRV